MIDQDVVKRQIEKLQPADMLAQARAREVNTYRKKPVVIKAICLDWDTWNTVAEWVPDIRGGWVDPKTGELTEGNQPPGHLSLDDAEIGAVIPTLEGDHLARQGDYIIQGVEGEFYPCKPNIFVQTYEPA